MAQPQSIKRPAGEGREVSYSTHSPSSSQSFTHSYLASQLQLPVWPGRQLKPFHAGDVKILLLENVNQTGRDALQDQGYQLEFHKSSLPEDELIEKIGHVHVIGIRSKTKLSRRVLEHAKNLLVIGCFCIGTNQVDLEYAAQQGIAVFNSPFANSRSVAELVICEIIALARQLADRSNEMHRGTWNKVSSKCWEIRGKTLGIVGYGHIGSQLSVLAEAMGMRVIYYDVLTLMAMGSAQQQGSLQDLLQDADFVTLHVPATPETDKMISDEQLKLMKRGAYLINASRGTVVDIPALIRAMRMGEVAGAALDVYPAEPPANGDYFNAQLNAWADELRSLPNVILTPHIGGSTEEAQRAIGVEVADAIVRYINEGATASCVNLPQVQLRGVPADGEGVARILFIHHNVRGVLSAANEILQGYNVDKQTSDSRGDLAYMMADVSGVTEADLGTIRSRFEAMKSGIRTRVLY